MFLMLLMFFVYSCYWNEFKLIEGFNDSYFKRNYKKTLASLKIKQLELQSRLNDEERQREIENAKKFEVIGTYVIPDDGDSELNEDNAFNHIKNEILNDYKNSQALLKIIKENPHDLHNLLYKITRNNTFEEYILLANFILRLIEYYKEQKWGICSDFEIIELDVNLKFSYKDFQNTKIEIFTQLLEKFPYINLEFFELMFSIYN